MASFAQYGLMRNIHIIAVAVGHSFSLLFSFQICGYNMFFCCCYCCFLYFCSAPSSVVQSSRVSKWGEVFTKVPLLGGSWIPVFVFQHYQQHKTPIWPLAAFCLASYLLPCEIQAFVSCLEVKNNIMLVFFPVLHSRSLW